MYNTVPDLTAAMRSHCPRGMGESCACAARVEARLEAGQSESDILAGYSNPPAFGPLIAAVLRHLTARPAAQSRLNLDHWDVEPEDDVTATDDGAVTTSRFDMDAFLAGVAAGVPGGGGEPATSGEHREPVAA